ncbi:MAG: membrane protein insertase YidC [Thermodesulfobacteriota bacterium]
MNNRFTINYIIFLALSFLIIFGFQYLFNNKEEKDATNQPAATEQTAKTTPETTKTAPPVKSESAFDDSKNTYEELIKEGSSGTIINVNSPLFDAKIDTLGGRVTEWKLKNYKQTTEKDSPLVNLINGKNQIVSGVKVKNNGIPYLIPYQYSGRSDIEIDDQNKGISLKYVNSSGLEITKTIEFDAKNYLLDESLTLSNNSGATQEYIINFQTFGSIEQRGRSESSNELFVFVNNEVEKVSKPPKQPEQLTGQINWFGFCDKYFLTAIIPEIGGNTSVSVNGVENNGLVNAEFAYPKDSVNTGASKTTKWKTYLGPKEPANLNMVGYGLEQAINYGWVGFLAKIALKFLKLLNSVFHNYGVSIIAITVILRVLFLPLTLKSMRSMKEMQARMAEVKPKIDALKEKYKDDKTKQNTELMKLYSSHGINPLSSLGGCFPLLLQLPVFIALYDVLLYSIDLRQTPFLWIKDLAEPEHLFSIPIFGDISLPFRILPLAMGVSWFISQKMTPMSAAPASESMELQMKMMQFMPIIFTVMFWGLPSGLILYWTVSNILSIGQQIYINRTVHVGKGGA